MTPAGEDEAEHGDGHQQKRAQFDHRLTAATRLAASFKAELRVDQLGSSDPREPGGCSQVPVRRGGLEAVDPPSVVRAAAAANDFFDGRQGVEDHALPHFLHRHPLELVRRHMRAVQPGQGAAAQLLGALGRDVHEQEAAGDGSGRTAPVRPRCRPSNRCFAPWSIQ